jgi:MFS family permease
MTASSTLALIRKPLGIVLFFMVVSSFSFFLTFPYLALYLTSQFGLPPAQTGAIVGFVTLVAAGGAWIGGHFVDWVGARRIMLLASALYSTGYLLLFANGGLIAEVLALFIVGAARMLMEPALKTLLIRFGGTGGRMFRIRYLILIIASSVAPLCVAFVPFEQFSNLFLVAGGLHALCGVVGALTLKVDRFVKTATETLVTPLRRPASLNIAMILASGFLFLTVFSQFETTFPLHLVARDTFAGLELYRYALVANALIALVIVLGVEALGWDTTRRGAIFLGTLALATAMLCLFLGGSVWVIALGVVMFTIGEALLFPLPDIYAARLAQPGREGRLMGLVDLRYFGFFTGPMLGGLALTAGTTVLAIGLAAIALMLLPLFLLARQRVYSPSHVVS